MQRRKKINTRSMPREQASSRTSRLQKKVTALPEKKVTELITSSTKKHKYGRLDEKKTNDAESQRNLNAGSNLSNDENQGSYFNNQGVHCHKEQSKEKAADSTTETIFSPGFHHSNDVVGGNPTKVCLSEISRNVDQMNDNDSEGWPEAAVSTHLGVTEHVYVESRTADTLTFACDNYGDATEVSSEAAYIDENQCHIEMNSKLECVDEQSQDTISTEGAEPDDSDDFDDFDPYLFIKDLPSLSAVVPRFRPMLLPKQTRSRPSITLVLDLDETLVHSTLEPCEDAAFTFPVNFNHKEHIIYVRCRPYLQEFLERVASMFETIIFTASQSIYAEQLLNILDPRRKLFRHRVYRESCVFVEGNYLKDLSVLGRDLSRVIIIDNSPQAFGFQIDNGIPIESWFDNRSDQELLLLLPFLESLVGVDDVRPLISQKFNLREKVAAAAYLSMGL